MKRDNLGSIFAVAFAFVLVFFAAMYFVCYAAIMLASVTGRF